MCNDARGVLRMGVPTGRYDFSSVNRVQDIEVGESHSVMVSDLTGEFSDWSFLFSSHFYIVWKVLAWSTLVMLTWGTVLCETRCLLTLIIIHVDSTCLVEMEPTYSSSVREIRSISQPWSCARCVPFNGCHHSLHGKESLCSIQNKASVVGHPRQLWMILSSTSLAFGRLESSLNELPRWPFCFSVISAGHWRQRCSSESSPWSWLQLSLRFLSDDTIFGEQGGGQIEGKLGE